jgi:hypothetical protein
LKDSPYLLRCIEFTSLSRIFPSVDSDLNQYGKVEIIVGHVGAPSTIYVNDGRGRNFTSVSFGDAQGTVYGFAVGDFNEDGIPDIAAARSSAPNVLYFGSRLTKRHK